MALAKFFRFPFAMSGDKATVPDDSQPSGSVSYEDGFGIDYELDPGVDPAAKDVPRDETNQLYFDITTAIKEYQIYGIPDFITTAQNGGAAYPYAQYARVHYSDGFNYESRVAANVDLPTDATKWRKLTENLDFLTLADAVFEGTVADGEAVYWDAANNRFDEAVADGTVKQNMVGFADVTNARVFLEGLYAGQLSALTPGSAYYLSPVTPGAISAVASAVRVGVARSATAIFINIGASAPPASETVAGIMEIATAAEAQTATDDTRAISPQKLASVLLGVGQTWQSMIGSRLNNTNYTNTTGRTIQVCVASQGTPGGSQFYVGGVMVHQNQMGGATSGAWGTSILVPPGAVYKAFCTGTIVIWYELR